MKVGVSREVDNLTAMMEVDDELTEIEVEDGLLHIYVNVGGENSSNTGDVYLTKDELEQIFAKVQEVKGQLKTTAELESSQ